MSVYSVSIPSSSGHWFPRTMDTRNQNRMTCFNPFFIRSLVPTLSCRAPRQTGNGVSIPSSSGHWFPLFQRDVSSPRIFCFNPFFIRSLVPTRKPFVPRRHKIKFQSLLHQVTGSHPDTSLPARDDKIVSIPSSSGHWFPRELRFPQLHSGDLFQSLLHQVTGSHCASPR